jgi:hypothetical protein
MTVLLFAVPVHAESLFISIAFDQTAVTIGRTPRLYIGIYNASAHDIQATDLQCTAQGTSLEASPIAQQPGLIAANGLFETEQFYEAVAPGRTDVTCVLNATDTVTGEVVTATSPVQAVDVSSETRLTINAACSAGSVAVGHTVTLRADFGNRGSTPFTNVTISCPEQGRSLIFVSGYQSQDDLQAGETGYAEYQLQAVRPGSGYFVCSITAVDETNASVTVLAPPVVIEVR